MPLSNDNDSLGYTWGSRVLSSSKTYNVLVGHLEIDPNFKWLWKDYYQPKHKVFYLLLIKV
jgi:hypothetical protein